MVQHAAAGSAVDSVRVTAGGNGLEGKVARGFQGGHRF